MSDVSEETSPPSDQKTAYGIPIRNLWHMLLYAWNEPPDSSYRKIVGDEPGPSLDALLAISLARLVQQRMRIGLGCDYIPIQRALRGIRGQIAIASTLGQRTIERGQVSCKFEEFSVNSPKNQIIRSTLNYLAQVGNFGPEDAQAKELRHRIRWLVRALEGIDFIELRPDTIQRQKSHRGDHDYRLMLAICDFVYRKRIPTEQAGLVFRSGLERDRYVLHRLYQDFVANFYRYQLSGWTVDPEKSLSWHSLESNKYLPAMYPDLTIEEEAHDGRIIVLDTKFTAKSLIQNRWGKEIFDSSHLYQIYAYLRTQEHLSEARRRATGILLYPAIQDETSEMLSLQGHSVRVECVNLAANWHVIEQRLLEVVLGHLHDSPSRPYGETSAI